jgi:hypothetical protein
MSQELNFIFTGLVGGVLGAAFVGSANLWINYRQRKKEASGAFMMRAFCYWNERPSRGGAPGSQVMIVYSGIPLPG